MSKVLDFIIKGFENLTVSKKNIIIKGNNIKIYGLKTTKVIKILTNCKGTSITSNTIQLKILSKAPISVENLFRILPEGV
jgi:hypothetical protein